jgi:hypothetical protein
MPTQWGQGSEVAKSGDYKATTRERERERRRRRRRRKEQVLRNTATIHIENWSIPRPIC